MVERAVRRAGSHPGPGRVVGGATTTIPSGAAVPALVRARGPAWVTVGSVVLVTCAGAVLRWLGIGDKSLWIDEAYSIWVARRDLVGIWRVTTEVDFHPPLYYELLHGWLTFGDGEAVVRSLSALFAALTVPIVYLIGHQVGGRRLGLVSSCLLAVSPLHLHYAHQARMYTLMTFAAALSVLGLLVVLRRDGHRMDGAAARATGPVLPLALFAVATAVTMYSHNTGVLLPLSVTVALAVLAVRRLAAGSAISDAAWGLTAALVLWLPWLPRFFFQAWRVDQEFWLAPPTWGTVLQHFADLTSAFGPDGAAGSVVLLVAAALAVGGVRALRGTPWAVLMVCLLLVPVAVALAVSLRRPVFFTQTLVWTSVPLSILLAAGVLSLRRRALMAVAAAVLLAANAWGVSRYHEQGGQEDWRGAVAYVAERVQAGDTVLFSAGWARIPFDYYYARHDGPPLERHGLPADVQDSDVLEPKMTQDDVPRLERLTSGRETVWVIYSHDWYSDPTGIVQTHLSDSFRPSATRAFPGIDVVRYRAKAA